MTGLFDAKTGARTLACDFSVGLFLFVVILTALSVPSTQAFPVPPPSELVPAGILVSATDLAIPALNVALPTMPTADDTPRVLLLGLLGLGFSAMVAINLAVVRHLRAAYTEPAHSI